MANRQRIVRKTKNQAPQDIGFVPLERGAVPQDASQYSRRPNTLENHVTPAHILKLQRTIGNQAVVRLLDKSPDRQTSLQRKVYDSIRTMWGEVVPGIKLSHIEEIVRSDPELEIAYLDIASYIKKMDFRYVKGKQPEVKVNPENDGTYQILYGTPKEQQKEFLRVPARFVAYILHEMMHVTTALQYDTNVAPKDNNKEHMVNMNLPEGMGERDVKTGLAPNQFEDSTTQLNTMIHNWEHLGSLSRADLLNKILTKEQQEFIQARIRYAQDETHYDTVLVDLLFYLANEGNEVKNSKTYEFAQFMLWEANSRRRSGKGKIQDLTR